MTWRNSAEAYAERNLPKPDLDDHRDDVINRYVVSGESPREIGERYRCGARAVASFLERNGVTLRSLRGAQNTAADRIARDERRAERIAELRASADHDDGEAASRADRRHVRLIGCALNGKGFPFYQDAELRI